VQFELAELLYTRNQSSAGHIDSLLHLWAASLVKHHDDPPFMNHADLYNTIDSTPLGDVPWESFSLKYNGDLPATDVPAWMTSDYDVWFRDPKVLVQNLISNPDFNNEFDYAPLQEYSTDGNHRFQDFMSGNWAWKQAVSSTPAAFTVLVLTVLRI
jgi:Plavaka transposase